MCRLVLCLHLIQPHFATYAALDATAAGGYMLLCLTATSPMVYRGTMAALHVL
jgi:hypothetical protein